MQTRCIFRRTISNIAEIFQCCWVLYPNRAIYISKRADCAYLAGEIYTM